MSFDVFSDAVGFKEELKATSALISSLLPGNHGACSHSQSSTSDQNFSYL